MPGNRPNLLFWLVLGGGALAFLCVCLLAVAMYLADTDSAEWQFGRGVAVLDLEGVIFDSKEFTEQLRTFKNRSAARSVVLRINSPGGGVAASQEIYQAIKKFRTDTKKKVVVSMSSVAASGGYYAACAADKIFANPGSITGSIGVIAEWYNYGDLLRWAKMEDVVIKSGDLKDVGNPTRRLTESERAYFQGLIDGMHDQFVAAVSQARRMEEGTVRKLADGRVYTGKEALALGLVDALGTYEDALAEAAKLAGIEGEPRVFTIAKKKYTLLDLVFGDSRSILSLNKDRSESQVRFQYLWR